MVVVTGLPNTSVTAVPSALVIDMVTPAMPASFTSWTPLRSASFHTKLPTATRGETKPKSRVMSLAPSTVRLEDVALPVEESIERSLPASAVVAM